VTRAALAIAVLLAWALGRRVPSSRQRAIAATLTGLLAVDVARAFSRPYPVAHVALFAAWYVVTAWGVVVVLAKDEAPGKGPIQGRGSGGSKCRPIGQAHLCPLKGYAQVDEARAPILPDHGHMASAALQVALVLAALFVAATLAVHLERTMDLERTAFRASLLVQLLAAGLFVSRWKRPDDAQIVALVLAGSTLGDVAGAWWYSDPVRDWGVGQIQALITWAAVAAWEGRCLIRARR
jgi:hypothetical protein